MYINFFIFRFLAAALALFLRDYVHVDGSWLCSSGCLCSIFICQSFLWLYSYDLFRVYVRVLNQVMSILLSSDSHSKCTPSLFNKLRCCLN